MAKNLPLFENTTENYWISSLQPQFFNTSGKKGWIFRCDQCGERHDRDKSPIFYKLIYPSGIDRFKQFSKFCSQECGVNWIKTWMPKEKQRIENAFRKEALIKEMMKKITEIQIDEEIIRKKEIHKDQNMWNIFPHHFHIPYVFAGDLTKDEMLMYMYLIPESMQSRDVEIDFSPIEKLGIKIEETIDSLITKGWLFSHNHKLRLDIPDRMIRFPNFSRESVRKELAEKLVEGVLT